METHIQVKRGTDPLKRIDSAAIKSRVELTGRDVSKVDYYRAFQYWRLAAIIEGVLSRYQKGVMGGSTNTEVFRAQVDGLAAAAIERIRNLENS